MVAALAVLWISVPILGRFGTVRAAMQDGPAMKAAVVGSVCGPFLGVTLSMVAVTYAIAGVASTLMSLMPVFVIPVIWVVFHQKTTIRGMAGAIVAVIGVAILFLVPG
jgi:drug/metabolite transporter (DMT)-like permease